MPPPWRVTCWLPATMFCNIYRPLGYQVPQVDYSFTPCCRALCFATQKSWIFTLFHGQFNLNGALPPESLRIQKSLYANGPGTMHGPLTFTALSYSKSVALSIACGQISAYFWAVMAGFFLESRVFLTKKAAGGCSICRRPSPQPVPSREPISGP